MIIGPKGIIQGPVSQIGRGGGLAIKSTQRASITLSGNIYGNVSRSDTVDINAVDTNCSIVQLMTETSGDDDGNLSAWGNGCYCKFVDSDTIIMQDNWYRNATANETFTYKLNVIEFVPSTVKSIQRIAEGFTAGNQTISEVDLDKAYLFRGGFASGNQNQQYDLYFVDSTTVYAEICGWIVEHY